MEEERSPKRLRPRKLTFDETEYTRNVPKTERETRAGLNDIEWNQIRNKETKKIAEICVFKILKHYNVQDESDLDEREFLDEDISVIRACLSVLEGLKPMPWQLKLIKQKHQEFRKNRKIQKQSEFERISKINHSSTESGKQ